MGSASVSQLTNKENLSWMNLEQINIFEPYSEKDWDKVARVLTELDSYVFFQILPEGQKHYRSLTDGIINAVPRKFLLLEHKNHGIKNKTPSDDETLPFENIIFRYIQAQSGSKNKDHLIGNEIICELTLDALPFKHSFAILRDHDSLNGAILKQNYLDMMITLNERCNFSNNIS